MRRVPLVQSSSDTSMCTSVFRGDAFHRGEDHHEVFVRAQLSGALDGDVEAWNECRQAQPVEDAHAEIQDSHGTDSRRESPGPTSRSVGAATLAAVTDPVVQPPVIDGSSAVPWRRVASPQVTPWPVG
jgi:hypothetical protein